MKTAGFALSARAARPTTLVLGTFLGAALVLAAGIVAPRLGHAANGARADVAAVQEGQPFEVKTEVVGECKVNTECTAKIRVEAKGDFHVNETYPFKFTADSPNAELHGSQGKVFVAGDFERQGKTVGVMTVKFKPTAKGHLEIAGKYKICICNDKICSPQTVDVSIPVDVK